MRAPVLAVLVLLVCACATPAAAPSPTPTQTPTPTATSSPSPSPSPSSATQVDAASYFVPSGTAAVPSGMLGYIPLPPAVEAQVLAGLQTDEIKVFAKSSAVRAVTKGGDALGAAVLVIRVDESFAALPNAFSGFVSGFTGSSAGAVMTQRQDKTIGGRPVVFMYHTDQQLWYAIWQQRVFFVATFAATQPEAEEVATALITVNAR